MIKPTIKESKDLSEDELIQLNAIGRLINTANPENHVQINHVNTTNPVFYLYKKKERILAFQAFSIFKKVTPFEKKEIPIIYINVSYKNPDAGKLVKDYAKKSNLHFIKQQLGSFWFLKKFLLIFITDNPKLLDRVSKKFDEHYPSYKNKTSSEVHAFCKNLITENLKIKGFTLSENLALSLPYHSESCISKHWLSMYKAADEAQNDFFYNEKIIFAHDDHIFLSGKGILFIGCYSFSNLLKSLKIF